MCGRIGAGPPGDDAHAHRRAREPAPGVRARWSRPRPRPAGSRSVRARRTYGSTISSSTGTRICAGMPCCCRRSTQTSAGSCLQTALRGLSGGRVQSTDRRVCARRRPGQRQEEPAVGALVEAVRAARCPAPCSRAARRSVAAARSRACTASADRSPSGTASLDVLALAGAQPVVQAERRGERREHAGADVDQVVGPENRRRILALHDAGHRLALALPAAAVPPRAELAVAADRGVDDVRLARLDLAVADAETVGRARARSSRGRRRPARPASRTPAAPRTTRGRAAASVCRGSGSRPRRPWAR